MHSILASLSSQSSVKLTNMTFYLFSHYLQSWLLPPGLHFLMISFGLLLCFYSRKLGLAVIVLGIVSLWLLSMPIVAYSLINFLQDQYPILQAEDFKVLKPNTAIVVLGAGNTVQAEYQYKKTVSDVALHRIHYGAYLQGKTQFPLILSGGKTNPNIAFSEAELMAEVLRENFNRKSDYLENQSLNTADESRLLKPVLKQKHWEQILLVTNAWHMPRSVYIFQCAGVRVIPAPMGHYVYGPGYALISYFPNMDALAASSIAVHEYLGLIWYRLRYAKQCIPA